MAARLADRERGGDAVINGIGASSASRTITVNSGAVLDFQGRDATGNAPPAFVINGGAVRQYEWLHTDRQSHAQRRDDPRHSG
jgi:hypothetical protein